MAFASVSFVFVALLFMFHFFKFFMASFPIVLIALRKGIFVFFVISVYKHKIKKKLKLVFNFEVFF